MNGATRILTKGGRPVDVVEGLLSRGVMPREKLLNFAGWMFDRLSVNKGKSKETGMLFTDEGFQYLRSSQNAPVVTDMHYNVKMLALLAIEARGYGAKGRRERRAQLRELTRMIRKGEREVIDGVSGKDEYTDQLRNKPESCEALLEVARPSLVGQTVCETPAVQEIIQVDVRKYGKGDK